MYQRLFGDRDPVAEPGTATGTPGDWWTVFANSPDVLEHAVAGLRAVRQPRPQDLSRALRELGQTRAGWLVGSQFVFSQHCKAVAPSASPRRRSRRSRRGRCPTCSIALERALLAYTDGLVLSLGRVDDGVFAVLQEHLDDEAILEFTYITMMYTMHAVMSVALRLEFDDRDDPIVEVAAPEDVRGGQHRLARSAGVTTASSGPLAGVRVLELGSFIAGPFAGQLLGDYGADVIKVESPGDGDPMRRWGITRDGDSLWWPTIARNKRSVVARPAPGAGARARRATWPAQCDVVLENFRPGTLERVGPRLRRRCRRANPTLVMVHVSGFGQTGPLAGQAGFGSVGEAMGGIRHTTGSPDRPPSRAGISLGDALGVGVRRDRHARRAGRAADDRQGPGGRRRHLRGGRRADGVDDGRLRARRRRAHPLGQRAARRRAVERVPDRRRRRGRRSPPTPTPCSAACATAMGRPELATDARFATHQRAGREHGRARRAHRRVDRDARRATTLLATLDEHGVPAGRIFTAPDMLTDPQYLARDMVRRRDVDAGMGRADDRHRAALHAARRARSVTPAPALGEHTDEVLRRAARPGRRRDRRRCGRRERSGERPPRRSTPAARAHAYAQVRAAIVENRYPPGQRLVEQRIAEELGLSRTPVREALHMLEAEGLVVSERHRGADGPPAVGDRGGRPLRAAHPARVLRRRGRDRTGDRGRARRARAPRRTRFGDVRRIVDVDTRRGRAPAPRGEPALPRRRSRAPPATTGWRRCWPARSTSPSCSRRSARSAPPRSSGPTRSTTSSSRRCAAATPTGPAALDGRAHRPGPRRRPRRHRQHRTREQPNHEHRRPRPGERVGRAWRAS